MASCMLTTALTLGENVQLRRNVHLQLLCIIGSGKGKLLGNHFVYVDEELI